LIASEVILGAVRPRLRRFVADTGDIDLIQTFTACDPETIGGWLATSEPLVQPLIKLWYLLEALGFPSPEMGQIAELNRHLGRLFGLGIITMDELKSSDLLKVERTQTAVQFLRGQASQKVSHENFRDLTERYDAALAAVLADLGAKYSPAVAPTQVSALEDGPTGLAMPVHGHVSLAVNTSDLSSALAVLVGAGVPLARQLAEAAPAERSRFRALLGTNALPLHDLLELLDALRTEAALAAWKKK